jgi:hypothetical protein
MIEKRPVGRPRKDLTDKEWEMLLSMLRINCTQVECCSVMDMDEDTLERNIKEREVSIFRSFIKDIQVKAKLHYVVCSTRQQRLATLLCRYG